MKLLDSAGLNDAISRLEDVRNVLNLRLGEMIKKVQEKISCESNKLP